MHTWENFSVWHSSQLYQEPSDVNQLLLTPGSCHRCELWDEITSPKEQCVTAMAFHPFSSCIFSCSDVLNHNNNLLIDELIHVYFHKFSSSF